MGPTEYALIFGGVVAIVMGAVHQWVRPKERRYRGPVWFLRMWEVRPWWCYALGVVLFVVAVLRAIVA